MIFVILYSLGYTNGMTPLHVAASFGDIKLYEKIEDISEDKLPKDNDEWTVLHAAAQ